MKSLDYYYIKDHLRRLYADRTYWAEFDRDNLIFYDSSSHMVDAIDNAIKALKPYIDEIEK